jgi:hypothetical protein
MHNRRKSVAGEWMWCRQRPNGKWLGFFKLNKNYVMCGTWDTEADAHDAVVRKRTALMVGSHAWNVPERLEAD